MPANGTCLKHFEANTNQANSYPHCDKPIMLPMMLAD